jgi:uncharacterized glyoxalase superfamily protein PhnB
MSTVAVLLGYHDVPAARHFFMRALGFDEHWAVTGDSGEIERSHLRLGDVELMIDRPAHGIQSPRDLGAVTHLVVIGVDDVHAHYKAALAAGATCDGPPTKQGWGGTSYTVRDDEGYLFEFYNAPNDGSRPGG